MEVLAKKDAIIEKLSGELETLRHQHELLLKRMFGRGSEKIDPNQLMLEALMLSAEGSTAPAPELPPEPTPAPASAAPSKRNGREPIAAHLKRNIIEIDAPAAAKICQVTGKERPLIGYEETEKYHYVPETLEVNVYRRATYGSVMGAEENGVFTAEMPESLVPRCLADASMLAHIAVSKFDDHLPLNRLGKMFLRQGAEISRKTMSDWMRALAEGLRLLQRRIRENILACGVVHHDHTPMDRLDPGAGQARESRLWVAIGRKNWLFLGSETGGETAATLMTILGTCWANRVNPQAYLEAVIRDLPGTLTTNLDDLLPHRWIESHPEARRPPIK